MKNILSFALISVAVVACTTTVTPKPAPAAAAPADDQATEDTDPTPAPAADAGDPCACPASCPVKDEPTWKSCNTGPAPKTVPESETIGNFYIGNFEYWPYAKPSPYPADTICGYNGEQVCGWPENDTTAKGAPDEQARQCMATARAALVAILKDVPPELEALRVAHGVNKFWNWNNDMIGTKKGTTPSSRQIWLYEPDRADHGLLKWISETERDGSCHVPTREEVIDYAKVCNAHFPRAC